MPNSSTAGTPSSWAAPASSTACEIDSRSTPGMASMGVRLSVPSSTNSGCTRCAGVSSVSRTMSRRSPVRRSRRMRVAGNAIAISLNGSQGPSGGAAYPQRVRHLAVSALGRDRPGIVERVTRVLLDHAVNVEDSQMTILRGHFTMMLVVAPSEGTDVDRLRADLDAAAVELELDALTVHEVAEVPAATAEPTHLVTVYGADHPGIVHAAAAALAERGLQHHRPEHPARGRGGGRPCTCCCSRSAVPPGAAAALESALDAVGAAEQVEVSVRELEQDAL